MLFPVVWGLATARLVEWLQERRLRHHDRVEEQK